MFEQFGRVRTLFGKLWQQRAVNVGVRLAIILLVLVWIARRLDVTQTTALLRSPESVPLFGMIACALLFGIIGGIKIWTLLRTMARVSLMRTILYFFVASSIGAFTPAALGDFSLAAFLKREHVPVHEGLAVVLVDRLVSVSLYVLVFTPLTLAFLAPNVVLWWLPSLFLLFGGFALAGNASPRLRAFVREKVVARFIPTASEFLATTSRLMRLEPLALLFNIGVGIVRCAVSGMVVWFALAAVGTRASLLPVIAATNMVAVINLIPLSFGGLGVYEGGGVLLFEQLGLSGAPVLAAFVLQRLYVIFSSLLFVTVAALYLFWQRRHVRAANEAGTL